MIPVIANAVATQRRKDFNFKRPFGVCFQLTVKSHCTFGNRCKFSHDLSKTRDGVPKAPVVEFEKSADFPTDSIGVKVDGVSVSLAQVAGPVSDRLSGETSVNPVEVKAFDNQLNLGISSPRNVKVYIDSLVISALIDSGATTNPVDSTLAMKILKVNKIIVLRPLIRLLV